MKRTVDLSNRGSIVSALSGFVRATINEKKLLDMTNEFVSTLVEEGASVAQANCPSDTGALRESITHFTETKGSKVVGTVSAGTQHAAFVEYGVGVVGAGSYPGELPPEWNYSSGKHIDEKGGWVYYDATRNQFRYTHGNEAKPFMYEASKYMERRAESLAKEVLK